MLLPSADNTCSHCHTLLPAQRTCYHSNCDGFQLLPWQRSSTPLSNLQRQRCWHLWEAKGHSVLWKGSGIGVNRLAQWPVIILETAEEQRPDRLTISPPYLLSCDLHTLVHVSNDWPGSFFHAVIISSGPCLPCTRGAVWYGHPLCGFHKCSSGFL